MQKFIFLSLVLLLSVACASDNVRTAKQPEISAAAAKPDDENPEAIFKQAESLRLSGDTKNAIKSYDKILAVQPDALYAMEGKSLCYVQQADFKQALVLLGDILNRDPARWRVVNALGVINASIGHMPEAMEYYNAALKISENNPSVLNNMGLSVAFGGDYKQGRELIEKAVANVKADDAKKKKAIEYNLAMVKGMSGDMQGAEKILDKYLSKPEVLNNLGFYAKLAKDNNLAKTYLTDAVSKSPVHYEKAQNNLKSLDPVSN